MKPSGRLILLGLLTAALAGCTGADTSVSKSEEEMFRNKGPVDMSKIPEGAIQTKGPQFIGEPSGATNPSGSKPPPQVTTGK